MPRLAWSGQGVHLRQTQTRWRHHFVVVAGGLPAALPRAPLLPLHPLDPPTAAHRQLTTPCVPLAARRCAAPTGPPRVPPLACSHPCAPVPSILSARRANSAVQLTPCRDTTGPPPATVSTRCSPAADTSPSHTSASPPCLSAAP